MTRILFSLTNVISTVMERSLCFPLSFVLIQKRQKIKENPMKLLRTIHLPYSMRSAAHRTSILTLIISWVSVDYYTVLKIECFLVISILIKTGNRPILFFVVVQFFWSDKHPKLVLNLISLRKSIDFGDECQ